MHSVAAGVVEETAGRGLGNDDGGPRSSGACVFSVESLVVWTDLDSSSRLAERQTELVFLLCKFVGETKNVDPYLLLRVFCMISCNFMQ